MPERQFAPVTLTYSLTHAMPANAQNLPALPTIPAIAAVPRLIEAALRQKIDGKTKPLGALGRLEALALQLGLVQGTLSPRADKAHLMVFAGDHGAATAGLSAYPQDVTWQMVENFLAGGAAINVFARLNDIGLSIVDAGVKHDFGTRPGLVDAKIGAGTASYLTGPAMTAEQCGQALQRGIQLAHQQAEAGCQALACGEMGIGNTAAASLITHCLTGVPLAPLVGRGTGLDDAGLARKRSLLQQALAVWASEASAAGDHTGGQNAFGQTSDRTPCHQPLAVLARFGGFEIAMMTGAMLGAAEKGLLVLVDGFICTAAALVAARLSQNFLDYAVFCHASVEPGHQAQLAALGVTPLLSLDMRLGEGTGAALAWPLIRAASAFLNDMASFASAGVAEKQP